jgi:hypothetical protein
MDPTSSAALTAAWLQAVAFVELKPNASLPTGPRQTLTDVIAGALRGSGLSAEFSPPNPNGPGQVVNRLA